MSVDMRSTFPMHDYYINRYTAARLTELRAEAARDHLTAARGARGGLWTAVKGAVTGLIAPPARRTAGTCCA